MLPLCHALWRNKSVLMDALQTFGDLAWQWLPALVLLLLCIGLIVGTRHFLLKSRFAGPGNIGVYSQLALFTLAVSGVVVVIVFMPIGDTARGQLLGLLGLLLSAAVALSSTTFIGNAMAGLMLRSVRNFKPGDFLKAGGHVGRVSELGLLHTEIQTEDRDLTTLPNLFLVTNPVTVVRADGTIVSATVSLGYDVSRIEIEKLLLIAAEKTNLKDPFVQISELGDYSVTYRVAGFLSEVKYLISVRAKLRGNVLDTLHGAGIEIVSPIFMNQRRPAEDKRFIPKESRLARAAVESNKPLPEEIIFDKADEAQSREELKETMQKLDDRISELGKAAASGEESDRLEAQRALERLTRRRAAIVEALDTEKKGDAK